MPARRHRLAIWLITGELVPHVHQGLVAGIRQGYGSPDHLRCPFRSGAVFPHLKDPNLTLPPQVLAMYVDRAMLPRNYERFLVAEQPLEVVLHRYGQGH